MWEQKTSAEIMDDLRAGVKWTMQPVPVCNVIPKSLWMQLPIGERKYYRYPKRFDFPLCAKRQRREYRQDLKCSRIIRRFVGYGEI